MDPFLLQWRLYNHNIGNSNLWSIKYNVYADHHRHVTKKTTDSSYVYYDYRGSTDRRQRVHGVDACLYSNRQSTQYDIDDSNKNMY
jgi:hypothetical protein